MSAGQYNYSTALCKEAMYGSGQHSISIKIEDGGCSSWTHQRPANQVNLCVGVAHGDVDVGSVHTRTEFVGSSKGWGMYNGNDSGGYGGLFHRGRCLKITGEKGMPPRDEDGNYRETELQYQKGDVIGMELFIPPVSMSSDETGEGAEQGEGQGEGRGEGHREKDAQAEQDGEKKDDTDGSSVGSLAPSVSSTDHEGRSGPTGTLTFLKNGVALEGAVIEGIHGEVHFAVTVYNSSEVKLRIA